MKTINIARDFSRYPAGRFSSDGPCSGEKFRKEFLLPVLHANEHAFIELDGTRGYGSSFLEEAFGGLVREGYTEEQIKSAFIFKTTENNLIDEIVTYIKESRP